MVVKTVVVVAIVVATVVPAVVVSVVVTATVVGVTDVVAIVVTYRWMMTGGRVWMTAVTVASV